MVLNIKLYSTFKAVQVLFLIWLNLLNNSSLAFKVSIHNYKDKAILSVIIGYYY